MIRKPCQCGSNCHNACECLYCCDCMRSMVGPVALMLREAYAHGHVAAVRNDPVLIQRLGMSPVAKRVIYDAARQLTGEDVGMAFITRHRLLPDVLSEATEAAEALDL